MPTPQPQPAGRRRKWGGIARRLAIRVPMGLLLAWAVAWTCLLAARIPMRPDLHLTDPTSDATSFLAPSVGSLQSAPGAFRAAVISKRAEIDLLTAVYMGDSTLNPTMCLNVQELPQWVARSAAPMPHRVDEEEVVTIAAGFPFMMLRCVTAHYLTGGLFEPPSWIMAQRPATALSTPVSSAKLPLSCPFRKARIITNWQSGAETEVLVTWGGIQLDTIRATTQVPSRPYSQGGKLPNALPLTPIWPGLLANTAIYTALIWLTCWSLATLRRHIHRWRHPNAKPCSHCRYDLSGINANACPECGELIPEQDFSATHSTPSLPQARRASP